jgi:hypothetical protein
MMADNEKLQTFEVFNVKQIEATDGNPANDLEEWKQRCPYGAWTCAGGREVMFNRSYWPILERSPPAFKTKVARAGEWIDHIKGCKYFFDDYSAPWRWRWTDEGEIGRRHADAIKSLTLINKQLTAWGVPPLKPPPHPPKRDPDAPLILHWVDFLKSLPPRPTPWAKILGGNP